MKIEIHGGFTTPKITREFVSELWDVKMDSLQGSFPGRAKPGVPVDGDDELEALGKRWKRQVGINELRDQIRHHIVHGDFRVAEHNGHVVGFAMAIPERVTLAGLAKRTLLRYRPKVKLDHLYMRSDYHVLPESELRPPVVQLGEAALNRYDPNQKRIMSFAAEEDWFVPEALKLMGMERYPAVQKPREDWDTFGDDDPLHIIKYESRPR